MKSEWSGPLRVDELMSFPVQMWRRTPHGKVRKKRDGERLIPCSGVMCMRVRVRVCVYVCVCVDVG